MNSIATPDNNHLELIEIEWSENESENEEREAENDDYTITGFFVFTTFPNLSFSCLHHTNSVQNNVVDISYPPPEPV